MSAPCPYLPDRWWTSQALEFDHIDDFHFTLLLEGGFRRSGHVFYRPVCRGCQECKPTRVLLDRFQPDRSQRRNLQRNADLIVTMGQLTADEERARLYARYLAVQHGKVEIFKKTAASYQSEMNATPMDTRELRVHEPSGRLVALGIVDCGNRIWSSVYTFFDAKQRDRGLGIFAILSTIQAARAAGAATLHLGYFVAGCSAMNYKRNFQPAESLGADGNWTPVPRHRSAKPP